ncbi:MAG: PEP-CTERM sorting domain-containing protein [Phycisphaerae bacterium]|nr:PEP-CTERM sorting domain-containing protein [Phycisphaerae bacterium]
MRSQKLACVCFAAVFFVIFASRAMAGNVTATLEVDAYIDHQAWLWVRPNSGGTGTDIIWHKSGNNSAPGRHGGNAYDTHLTSSLGESASWTPLYPRNDGNGDKLDSWGEAISHPCTELTLASNFYDPTGQYNNIVQLDWVDPPRAGAGAGIVQQPKPSNGFYLKVEFGDGVAGASWIHPEFTYPAKSVLDYEWLGGDPMADFGEWENWSSHRVPGASQVAVFNSGINLYRVFMGGHTVGGIRIHDNIVALNGPMTVNDSVEVQPDCDLTLTAANIAPATVSVRAGAGLELENSTIAVEELTVDGYLDLKQGEISVSGEASMHNSYLSLAYSNLNFLDNSTWSGTLNRITIKFALTSQPGDTVSVINYGDNVQRSGVTSREVYVDGDIAGDGYWETRSLFTNGYIKAIAYPGPRNDSAPVTTNDPQADLLGGVQTDSGVRVEFAELLLGGDLSVEQKWVGQDESGGLPLSSGDLDVEQSLVAASEYDGLPFSVINFFPGGTVLQLWDLQFTGEFGGTASVTLNFHEEFLAPGFDMQDLSVRHYVDGEWINLGGIVDEENHTIQFETDSFSPFALGTDVPEPSALVLLCMGLAGLLRRRKVKRRPRASL